MMRTLKQFLRATLVGGLIFLVPLALVAFVVGRALGVARELTKGLDKFVPAWLASGPVAELLVAAVLLLLVTFLAGLFARTEPGQGIVAWVQRSIVATLPQFRLAHAMLSQFEDEEHCRPEVEVVLVREDGWLLGFIFEPVDGPYVPVFVPDAPGWTAGKVSFMARENLRPAGINFGQAIGILSRLGAGGAKLASDLERQLKTPLDPPVPAQ